jgi:hypothetical protein
VQLVFGHVREGPASSLDFLDEVEQLSDDQLEREIALFATRESECRQRYRRRTKRTSEIRFDRAT